VTGLGGTSQNTASAPVNAWLTTSRLLCDPLAGGCGKARRVARDRADWLAFIEDVREDLVTDVARGRGHDDHGKLRGMPSTADQLARRCCAPGKAERAIAMPRTLTLDGLADQQLSHSMATTEGNHGK
jgi:hypothetical protein